MQTLKSVLLVESLKIYDKDNKSTILFANTFHTFIDVQARDKVSIKFKYDKKTYWCFRSDMFIARYGVHPKHVYTNNEPLVGNLILHGKTRTATVLRITSAGDLLVRDTVDGVQSTIPYVDWILDTATISTAATELQQADNLVETIGGVTTKIFPRTKHVTIEELPAFIKHLDRYDKLAYDTETTGLLQQIYTLDDREDFVVCITVSTSADNGYYIYNDKSQQFRDLLKYLCTKHLIMHNAAFDMGILKIIYDLVPKSHDDTMIMYKCIDDSMMSYGLKSLVDEVSSRGKQLKLSDFDYLEYVALGMYKEIESIASYYACYDTSNTYLLYNHLIQKIKNNPALYKYYVEVEMASILPVSIAINQNGLKVDTDQLLALDIKVRDHLVTLHREMQVITQPKIDKLNQTYKEDQIRAMQSYAKDALKLLKTKLVIKTPVEEAITEQLLLNCNYLDQPSYDKIKTLAVFHNRLSTRQTGVQQYSLELGNKQFMELLLYSSDGYDLPMQQSKSGKASINKAAIGEITKYIIANEEEIPELKQARQFFIKFSEYVKTKKLLEAFVTPALEVVRHNKDGKLHPNYNLFGTVSSRASCSNPNFQQLASNKSFDIRKCFVVDDEHESFIQCDFNAQELRVMAALSKDPTLTHIIMNNIDAHCETVRRVWKEHAQRTDEDIIANFKSLRTIAKVVMFSLAYGARARKMAFILGITESEAEVVLSAFKNDAYPVLTKWLDDAGKQVVKDGYADILGGYRRHFHPTGNRWQDAAQVRSIVNSLIQGASAYITKVCTLNTLKALREAAIDYKLIILIHDSITLQFKDSDIPAAFRIVEDNMYYDFMGIPVNSLATVNKDMSKETEMELADFLEMMEEDE